MVCLEMGKINLSGFYAVLYRPRIGKNLVGVDPGSGNGFFYSAHHHIIEFCYTTGKWQGR
jgi:hypothetical protein